MVYCNFKFHCFFLGYKIAIDLYVELVAFDFVVFAHSRSVFFITNLSVFYINK